ncbi:MAG: hypothetical protein IPJ74_26570 [Saprospiraceae bacterium]|nr:hypothetical protein [Saprospiraceae bacterium]
MKCRKVQAPSRKHLAQKHGKTASPVASALIILETEMHTALATSLARYDINLDFKFDIVNNSLTELMPTTYCAADTPLSVDNQAVHVSFSDKEQYIIQQMGFMTGTSFLFYFLLVQCCS